MKVSIVIVSYNAVNLLIDCLSSIMDHSKTAPEIIVVDNGSTDRSVELLAKEFPQIRLIPLAENMGFGAGNNRGAAVATGELLFFLNNDTVLLEDTPAQLAGLMETHADVGACGPKLVNGDGGFQLSFGSDPSLLNEWKFRRMHRRLRKKDSAFRSKLESRYSASTEVDWVTGAVLMLRRDVFREIGGFDETFFLYFEDADICRRVRELGLKVLYVPTTKVVHFGGQSLGTAGQQIAVEYRRSQLYYYQKHSRPVTQLFLRVYLICKFGIHWLYSSVDRGRPRWVASEIIKLSLRSSFGKS